MRPRRTRGVRGLLSHPFARKKAKGWGTEHWWEVWSGTAWFVLSQVSKSRPGVPGMGWRSGAEQPGSCFPRSQNRDLGHPSDMGKFMKTSYLDGRAVEGSAGGASGLTASLLAATGCGPLSGLGAVRATTFFAGLTGIA